MIHFTPSKLSSTTLIILTAIILSVTLLGIRVTVASTDTRTVSQTVETTVSAPTQAMTPTVIISPSPAFTPTPPYPSVQDIKNALSEDFDEIKGLLQSIDQKAESRSSLTNIRDNLISSVIWDYVGTPIVSGLLLILASSTLGKIAVKLKLVRDTSKGEALREVDVKLNLILNAVIITSAVIFVLLLLSLPLSGQARLPASSTADLAAIMERLDGIESELQVLSRIGSSATPVPPVPVLPSNASPSLETSNLNTNLTPVITSVLIVSVFVNVMLVFYVVFNFWGRRVEQGGTEVQALTQQQFELSDKGLLIAILLALILLLLPYPADTILLPFIVRYFILAFFNVVRLYPNEELKQIVAKRYSLLIFLAALGAWFSFWDTVPRFFYPVWGVIRSLVLVDLPRDWYTWIGFLYDIAPLLLAVMVTIPHWRRLTHLSEEKAIPEIRESLDRARGGTKPT